MIDKPCKLISDIDKEFFDGINCELMQMVGTDVKMWSLDKTSEYINPVYREPKTRISFNGPYTVMAFVTKPDWIFDASEKGLVEEIDSLMTLSRKLLEDNGIPVPKIGDVFEFWGSQYDVIKVEPDGFLNDTSTFVQWIVSLKRRKAYVPEKKET